MDYSFEKECRFQISKLQGPGGDNALHSLMELPNDALPILIELFGEHQPPIQQDIVHAIWQHRDQSVLPFLIEVIENEENELLWQEALDGVITLGGSNAVLALTKASVDSTNKGDSICEAIELLETSHA